MATGIIVEYNPMHLGHIHHAMQARQDQEDTVIAVMSGWFVQRGEPAIVDPYIRASIAVKNGVDLVLLLPVIHSIQSAEYFARGGVDILRAAQVRRLVYGSETPEHRPPSDLDENLLRGALMRGDSFAAAMQQSRQGNYLDANTRLGLCYQRAIRQTGASITAQPILRAPWPGSTVPLSEQNATSIREQLLHGQKARGLAEEVPAPYHRLEDYFSLLTHFIRFPREDPAQFPYYEPGLDRRLLKTRKEAKSMDEWIEKARSKRHTKARIRRFLLHLLLNLNKKSLEQAQKLPVDALVPLAMNEKGQAHLKRIKGDIPVLSTRKAWHRHCARQETALAWDLYAEKLYYAQ